VRCEVALAKDELRREVSDARRSTMAFGVAFLFLSCASTLLLLSLALQTSVGIWPIVVEGVVLLAIAAGAALWGLGHWPGRPLKKTERRLTTDIDQLKEHLT
jgi:hypothetical protein